MNNTEVVTFVYLGKRLPRYARSSLPLAAKYSGLQVRLVGNSVLERYISDENISFTSIESFYDAEEFSVAAENLLYSHTFRGGFWLKSLERLFVIEQYMRFKSLDTIFHSELDQLLFRTDLLTAKLDDRSEAGIFLPFDRPTAALASVLYCNNRVAFRSLLDFAGTGGFFHNEMSLLANWTSEFPNYSFALPTIDGLVVTEKENSPTNVKKISVNEVGGIVDAARLGQWIGGIDPRNVLMRDRPKTKFFNENVDSGLSRAQMLALNFEFAHGEGSLTCNYRNLFNVNVYNLHIHSKVHTWLLRSDPELTKLFEQANQSFSIALPGTRFSQISYILRRRLTQIVSNRMLLRSEIVGRLNRKFLRRPGSEPFISGDTFRALADHLWESENENIQPSLVKSGDVIFCESERMQSFRERILDKLQVSIVLLLGNSDLNHNQSLRSLIETGKIKAIFAQNLIEPVIGTEPLPLGLENAWRSNHGQTSSFRHARKKSKDRRCQIMWTFSVSTNLVVRSEAAKVLADCKVADNLGRVSPRQHRKALRTYAFVASPPGNGLDTHRTWEAMYLGCIPLVLRSHMTEFYEALGLPVWILNSYEDVIQMSEEDLRLKYEELKPKFESAALWIEYWEDRIRFESQSAIE